ncbi:MAG: DUF309 domain-containing protein [Myxococcota bacterium]
MDDARLARGAALFRRGDYLEAHEVWEDGWRPMPPGPDREIAQGLIQAAVALHHRARGNDRGARAVGERALRRLEGVPATWRGLDLETLRWDLARGLEDARGIVRLRPVERSR